MALRLVNYTEPGSGTTTVFYDDGTGKLTQGSYICDPGTPGTALGLIASALYVKLTDGTNAMPTMDAAARKGFHAITDGTNTATVKSSAGQVYGYDLSNNTSSAKYVKFYNKATAPTVGTDTPLFTVMIPANGGRNVEWSMGIPFGSGIGYGITGAITDADTTSVAADDVHGVLLYK